MLVYFWLVTHTNSLASQSDSSLIFDFFGYIYDEKTDLLSGDWFPFVLLDVAGRVQLKTHMKENGNSIVSQGKVNNNSWQEKDQQLIYIRVLRPKRQVDRQDFEGFSRKIVLSTSPELPTA